MNNAWTLEKGSQVEFPKDGKAARGESKRGQGMTYIPMSNAMTDAIANFSIEFGREPELDKLMFRGFYTTSDCVVEICEVP